MTEHNPVAGRCLVEKVEDIRDDRAQQTRSRSTSIGDALPERKVRDVPQLRESMGIHQPANALRSPSRFQIQFEKRWPRRDPKALELHNLVEDVKSRAAKFMKVKRSGSFSMRRRREFQLNCLLPVAVIPSLSRNLSLRENTETLRQAQGDRSGGPRIPSISSSAEAGMGCACRTM